ncbi:MAG: tripartite tricarboxylate transporter substrate binding protein, partial [Betaproteobacteria bacterium]|nr:tripartite tricarboxylate transporter substrate binding protein [Betaproteobacteria bacterium]
MLALSIAPAIAETYPDRPLRLIVPYAPGGGTDLTSRLIARQLTATLNQQVIVDNRAGGAANIGCEIAARSAPDGYTLLMAGISFSINVSMFAKLNYHPVKDFDPVSLVATVPLIVVVHPSVPATSIRELITLAKAKPGTLNYGSGGTGTANHIAGELFKFMTGTEIVHVPYKGGGPALADIVGGQIQLLFNTMTSTVGFMSSGKLRALAVTGKQRSPGVPNLPTVAEAGVPGYDVGAWFGIVVPKGTPRALVNKLNSEIVRVTRLPEAREQFAAQGAEAIGSTPEEFAQHLRIE